MEKLIELLNEYSIIRNNARIVEWVEHTKGNLYWEYWENAWSYMVVISKEYGFIKWLVENDKIDRSKVLEEIGGCIKISGLGPHYSFYSALLMILAVSDTPIEDLISYLK